MPYTRRQKAEARRSRVMDVMSYLEMDVLLGNEKVYPIGRELAYTINNSISYDGLESDYHTRGNPSNENEIREFSYADEIPRQDRILESMQTFPNEISMRLSQEMDAMMSMMHPQINRAISSMISE